MTLPIREKAPAGAAAAAAAPDDLRTRLRRHRAKLAADSTKLFVLPGYDKDNPELGGELLARYRRMGFEELAEAFKGVGESSEPGKIVTANAQFLIDCCDEILFRDHSGLRPLVPGAKTTFTINLDTSESLATFLGIENRPTARDQLVEVFGGNELTVNQHSGDVHRWMISANRADAQAALGEA
jgi:hypothetical protein